MILVTENRTKTDCNQLGYITGTKLIHFRLIPYLNMFKVHRPNSRVPSLFIQDLYTGVIQEQRTKVVP